MGEESEVEEAMVCSAYEEVNDKNSIVAHHIISPRKYSTFFLFQAIYWYVSLLKCLAGLKKALFYVWLKLVIACGRTAG